jgi:hypothetical protein
MRAPFAGILVPTNPSAICPQCRSTNLLAVGRVFASRSGSGDGGRGPCERCAGFPGAE